MEEEKCYQPIFLPIEHISNHHATLPSDHGDRRLWLSAMAAVNSVDQLLETFPHISSFRSHQIKHIVTAGGIIHNVHQGMNNSQFCRKICHL